MQRKFSIDRDLYFNTYDPDYTDPFWKASIKKIIGWQTTELEKNSIIENNVLENYRENVVFELTDGGAIQISVMHNDPEQASYYAWFYGRKFDSWWKRKAMRQALRLNYLSETLADALQDMEKAQENLKLCS